MDEFEKLQSRLMQGAGGEKMRQAAASPQGQKLLRSLDTAAVEKAAKQGDMAALKNILQGVLATKEGQDLAKMIKASMEGK